MLSTNFEVSLYPISSIRVFLPLSFILILPLLYSFERVSTYVLPTGTGPSTRICGQDVVRDILLCGSRRHLQCVNIFQPFPDKTEMEGRGNFYELCAIVMEIYVILLIAFVKI